MMENIVHDQYFNGNEWFVITLSLIGIVGIWLFPRPFSPTQMTFNMMIGVTLGFIFDHTIEIPPFDFYDVGDQSKFQLFDLFSYIMYAPFGYWFIYWYERLRMYELMTIFYIFLWTLASVGFEWLAIQVGVFHYKDGYEIVYSFPIYMFVQSLHLAMYRMAFSRYRMSEENMRKHI